MYRFAGVIVKFNLENVLGRQVTVPAIDRTKVRKFPLVVLARGYCHVLAPLNSIHIRENVLSNYPQLEDLQDKILFLWAFSVVFIEYIFNWSRRLSISFIIRHKPLNIYMCFSNRSKRWF